MKTGVYIIRNIANGKGYIGSTQNSFQARFRSHKSLLRKNKHHSPKLQAAWNKHGEQSFMFEVIKPCIKDECLFQEQLALTFHHSEYNISYTASSVMAGRKHSLESKRKMSTSGRGRPKSQQWKDMMSTKMLGNTRWVGRTHNEKTKLKMSEAAKRRWQK
jgi:group I intron endonuclease